MIIIPEDVLRIAEALSAPIDELGLSVRSYNGLRRCGITTVADVYRAHQDKQLPRIRNLGEKSVIEIEKHLEEHLAKVAPASSSEFPNNSDTISRAKAIEALDEQIEKCDKSLSSFDISMKDEYAVKVERASLVAFREILEYLPPAQPAPSQVAKDIARIVENGQDMRVIAQPEIIRCKDCKHWIPYDWMFSEVWRSKNMTDYPEDEIGCNYCDMTMKADDFCSRAEMREVTT